MKEYIPIFDFVLVQISNAQQKQGEYWFLPLSNFYDGYNSSVIDAYSTSLIIFTIKVKESSKSELILFSLINLELNSVCVANVLGKQAHQNKQSLL